MSTRETLRRLAEGAGHRETVAAAAAATRDVSRAATFVDRGGLERLDRAVEAAERAGDREAARIGRAAAAALRRPLSPRSRNRFTRRRPTD
ncbi:MAG: hypothetical protein ABEH47_04695 [Haloferacaceae archaeon]